MRIEFPENYVDRYRVRPKVMIKFRTIIAMLGLLILLAGCSAHTGNVVIRDYVAGGEYEIVEVDGKPATRRQHGGLVTHVPFVLVSEGAHRLTVRYRKAIDFSGEVGQSEYIDVEIQKGRDYVLIRKDGRPLLVEQESD